jgi:protein involved in polysaccharide export with SLBB domain
MLPPELLAEPKELKVTIPLTFLRQKPPEAYRLAAGDVLGVYIEGVLGDRNTPPPVSYYEGSNLPPSLGYPIPIRENGTLPLPLLDPILVAGMTLPEAEKAIIDAYTAKGEILRPGRERVIVTLIRPRQTRVLVIRQDTPAGESMRGGGRISSTRGVYGGAEVVVGGARRGNGTRSCLKLSAVGEN